MTHHPHFLDRDKSLLLVVDIQEKLYRQITRKEDIEANSRKLILVAKRLNVPILATEQYPKGLGGTIPAIVEALGDRYEPIEKVTFSCCGADGLVDHIQRPGPCHILLCGIEAHVCVFQTALDLLALDYTVHVAADAVSSRSPDNARIAIEAMRQAGAIITTTESAIFQWLERAGTEEFKDLLSLLK